MVLKPVKSSSIAAVGYDPATAELHIAFQGGGVYAYDSVSPEVHTALVEAKSIGRHFHANIRNQYKARKLK